MLRKQAIAKTTGFQLASLQLQDYHMWLSLLQLGEVGYNPERLLKYRVFNNNANLSNMKNYYRIHFEYEAIFDSIFDNINLNFFKITFKEDLTDSVFEDQASFHFEQTQLYLNHSENYVKKLGLKKLFALLQDPEFYQVFTEKYKKSLTDYFYLTNTTPARLSVSDQVKRCIKIIKNSLCARD
jgi:hypothetical protein